MDDIEKKRKAMALLVALGAASSFAHIADNQRANVTARLSVTVLAFALLAPQNCERAAGKQTQRHSHTAKGQA